MTPENNVTPGPIPPPAPQPPANNPAVNVAPAPADPNLPNPPLQPANINQPLKNGKPLFSKSILGFALIFAIIGGYLIYRSFAATPATSFSLNPYTSRANQIDRFSSGPSIYDQPWRGYMETVPATKFLNGIGVNYNLSTKVDPDAALKLLSQAGIHSIRKEVGWGSLNSTETDLDASTKQSLVKLVMAAKKYGITPLILLNANDGNPQPMAMVTAKLSQSASKGATTLVISGTPSGLTAGKTGFDISGKPKLWQAKAGSLFKTITQSGGKTTVTLSRALPSALSSGTAINIATFKHLPLYPVGTPQFEDTAKAWVNYANIVAKTVAATGVGNFDVEIWNELTFGSSFLDINKYYDSPLFASPADKFKSGGSAWEMANRTVKSLKSTYGNKVKVIWGFSNTSFYHTPSNQLPAQIDGESYHPYHTKLDTFADIFKGQSSKLLGSNGQKNSYVPSLNVNIPEGEAATDWTTSGLVAGKLAPWVRNASRPTGTTTFLHYITEHGVTPGASGIKDVPQAQILKAKSLLRMYSFWLNKGIDKLDVYATHTDSDSSFGIMNATSPLTATPELNSMKNMASLFAGATTIASPRQLDADVTATGPQYQVFPASGSNPALWYRDLFTLLPFQVNANKFVVGAYILSPNNLTSIPPMSFNVTIKNVNGTKATVSYYDPYLGTSQTVKVLSKTSTSVTVAISAVDYPRFITISD